MPVSDRRGEGVMLSARTTVVAICGLMLSACAHGEKSFEKFAAAHEGAEILPVAFVAQEKAADCGAAALTSVGRFWGVDVPTGAILTDQGPINPAFGYSVGELYDASAKLGLTSSRLLEQPDYLLGLVDDGMPVIAPIAKPYERRDIFDFMVVSMLSRLIVSAFVDEEPTVNHYVVVLGADEDHVYFLDPQDGYRAMARNEFLEHWNDLTLKFVPDAGESVAGFVTWREASEPVADGVEPELSRES
jgi:ABC-type bacteriocin/lantibiotic exporter with double-glycine peptidase domain